MYVQAPGNLRLLRASLKPTGEFGVQPLGCCPKNPRRRSHNGIGARSGHGRSSKTTGEFGVQPLGCPKNPRRTFHNGIDARSGHGRSLETTEFGVQPLGCCPKNPRRRFHNGIGARSGHGRSFGTQRLLREICAYLCISTLTGLCDRSLPDIAQQPRHHYPPANAAGLNHNSIKRNLDGRARFNKQRNHCL